MAIELVITDETPQPVLVDTDDFLRACTPPVLTEQEVLDCFLETKLDGSYRQYLLAAGRAIERKLQATRVAGYFDLEALHDLQNCNGRSVWAESAGVWEGSAPPAHLVPLFVKVAA
jgi:hypothetical protein